MGISSSLLAACSLLLGGCWAGPIGSSSRTPHNLNRELHDAFSANTVDKRGLTIAENLPELWSRSDAPDNSKHSSIWVVVAVICIILLICLLIIAWAIVRRSKDSGQKTGSDEELGFGKYPQAQPDIIVPPKTYDSTSVSYSPPVGIHHPVGDIQKKHPPPPLLTISSPEEETGSKLTRVPVPRHLLSPRLIGLPPSPRMLGLPTSPRPSSPGHGPSHGSSDLQRTSTISPPSDSSPSRGSTSSESPPEMDYYYHQGSLSAGGLERMMTQMEKDLSDQRQSSSSRGIYSARV